MQNSLKSAECNACSRARQRLKQKQTKQQSVSAAKRHKSPAEGARLPSLFRQIFETTRQPNTTQEAKAGVGGQTRPTSPPACVGPVSV